MKNEVAVLYSGGTDSTCAAAILAEKFEAIHLLTFKRLGFFEIENSSRNIGLLRKKFPAVQILHRIIDAEPLAQYVNREGFLRNIFKFGFFTLSNCLVCGIINHFATLLYCLDNKIAFAADGSTREWSFFPTHMEKVILELKEMYSKFNIDYQTPVYDFDLPAPLRLIDRLNFSREPSENIDEAILQKNTTGNYLYRLGIFSLPNLKGSNLDHTMQPRCFQFILHHIYVYWNFMQRHDYADFESETLRFFKGKIDNFSKLIENSPVKAKEFIGYIP